MASYSLPSFFSANGRRAPLFLPNKPPKTLSLIRVHSFQDEGRYTIVDENMSVLKERMEVVKVKEKLERCCRCENGWNYHHHHNYKQNLNLGYDSYYWLVFGTVGSTCLSGTLLLCLLSLFVHLHSFLPFN
ncbi:uncharacterized protein LOC129295625 [Prosopis cineraria]|uniref:uncharacterized protein LOC129295625 n=1 Tax=Prosopis cineraria TaxID=364024 RepID=UPI00240FACA7|nr:uncharacterized protein LOC129295625 [Prosopis cineraria]